ncbi:hypothetical protein ACFL1U_03130 [Patescibacteria group bacterium]
MSSKDKPEEQPVGMGATLSLTPAAQKFVNDIVEQGKTPEYPDEFPRVQASKVSSSLATLYEKMRNTIDSTEQHLLRRNAIYRFLRRNVIVYGIQNNLGDLLIRELVRSGYVATNTFLEQDIPKLDIITQKYLVFTDELRQRLPQENPAQLERWSLQLAAIELERQLYNPSQEETLLQFAFEHLRGEIVWEDNAFTEEERDFHLYLAIHRALFKSDHTHLEYHLLKSYCTGWEDFSVENVSEMVEHAVLHRETAWQHIHHPLSIRLTKKVRRLTIPFQTLMDAIRLDPTKARQRIQERDAFLVDTQQVINGYYETNRKTTRRSTIRSIFFIFITKMAVALVFEIPYDLWVIDKIRYLPLGINVVFHPVLLFMLGTFVRFPGKENTKRIINDLRDTIVEGREKPQYHIRLQRRRSVVMGITMSLIYLITFVAVFGAIGYGLWYYDFGAVGSILFLFFLSLVVFMGARLRTRAKHYYLVRQKETFFGAIFEFITNPIVEVGHWFSSKFARYNLFLFLFDIILEAPFKAITYGIEEWFRFARERREEILD